MRRGLTTRCLPVLILSAAVLAEEQICVLELAKALPGDKTLMLHLRLADGKAETAFAVAPTFNRMPYDVEASALKLQDGRLSGEVKVTVHSDGYVPKDAEKVECRYALDVKLGAAVQGSFSGRYGDSETKGEVGGGSGPPPALAPPLRVTLDGENLVVLEKSGGKKGGGRRARIHFGLRDGRAVGVKLDPPGSITDTSMGARIEESNLKCDARRLSGTLKFHIEPQGRAAVKLACELEGDVIGLNLAGRCRARCGDGEFEDGRFLGRIQTDAAKAEDCLWNLVLHDALKPGGYLKLYLATRDGKFVHGFAASPNFNNATHEVDLRCLALEGAELKGALKITVHPDPWQPPDHKLIPCEYQIRAKLQDAEIQGEYEGRSGDKTIRGPLDGNTCLRPSPAPPVKATLKLEDALPAANQYFSRVFFSMQIDGGRITGGNAWNNHNKNMKGTVDGGEFKIEGDAFTATFKATIPPGTGMKGGTYSIAVNGACIGTVMAGGFELSEGDKLLKTGRFWGAVQTEPKAGR